MAADIRWINAPLRGKLGIMGRPRTGEGMEDDVANWQKDRIHLVVSVLDDKEVAELNLAKEAYVCQKFSIAFTTFPVPYRGVPASAADVATLVQAIKVQLQNAKTVLIHSRSGTGRAAVIAACVLRSFGIDTKKAFELIASARGFMVPDTPAQREWVQQYTATTGVTG